MFLQPHRSWLAHINFVHPATPTLGRLLSFLPHTRARTIVVFPSALARGQWWTNMIRLGAPGVRFVRRIHGFVVVAFDHTRHRSLTHIPHSACTTP